MQWIKCFKCKNWTEHKQSFLQSNSRIWKKENKRIFLTFKAVQTNTDISVWKLQPKSVHIGACVLILRILYICQVTNLLTYRSVSWVRKWSIKLKCVLIWLLNIRIIRCSEFKSNTCIYSYSACWLLLTPACSLPKRHESWDSLQRMQPLNWDTPTDGVCFRHSEWVFIQLQLGIFYFTFYKRGWTYNALKFASVGVASVLIYLSTVVT